MDRLIPILAGALLAVSCQRTVPETPEMVRITFSATDATRSGTDGNADIRRWALLLFRDGRLADCGLSASAEPITRTVQAGAYTAFAVANYPENDFRPDSFRTAADLTERTVDLTDHTPDAPVMCGRTDLVLPAGADGVQAVTVDRLVCKAGLRKISVDFTDPTLAAQPFLLRSIFLTNCVRWNRYGADPAPEDLSDGKTAWYNPMGLTTGSPETLAVRSIDTAVTPSEPYGVPQVFLFHPNPVEESRDTHAGEWSRRCTRMVIEAQIGDRTCYYPVTLPPLRRNQACVADEVVIRRAGSPDPEQEVPDAVEIRFSASVQPWEQQYDDKDTL